MARFVHEDRTYDFYFWPVRVSTPRAFDDALMGRPIWQRLRKAGIIKVRRVWAKGVWS